MSTTVIGTLVDSLGQIWSKASIQFIFKPTPSTPGPFLLNGLDFNKMPPKIVTDVNGSFSQVLPSNTDIAPANSQWQVVIAPNSSYQAIILEVFLTGSTFDISSLFLQSDGVKLIQSLMIPRAYADSEVIVPPNVGQLYYNVVDKVFKYWESGNWATLASSGGMVYPPAGIAVSTGTGWAASLDPTNVAFKNINNNFTSQTINGTLTINGIASVTGNIGTNADLYVAGISHLANGHILIGIRTGTILNGTPGISTDNTNLYLNSAANGFTYFNFDQGGHGVKFFDGSGAGNIVAAIDQNGSAYFNSLVNVASLQVAGVAPVGQVLTGNGTSYVPMPIPGASLPTFHADATNYAPPARDFDQINRNSGTGPLVVSGLVNTFGGGHVGSVECLIGSSNPTIRAFGMTTGAEVDNGTIGFNFTVPPGWLYQIRKNTLTNNQGTGVTTVNTWVETQYYLS
jgi:hypothetical protein